MFLAEGVAMSVSAPVWQFRHSVCCCAPRDFAWRYWTNVANWDDPPARFQIEGPFCAGSKITTNLPGHTLHSVIRQVSENNEAIIDLQLPHATLTFHWTLESLSGNQTRITQHLELSGVGAGSLIAQAGVLEQSTPNGMKKLVAAIESAYEQKTVT
jgi:hypothetical protein